MGLMDKMRSEPVDLIERFDAGRATPDPAPVCAATPPAPPSSVAPSDQVEQ